MPKLKLYIEKIKLLPRFIPFKKQVFDLMLLKEPLVKGRA